MIRNVLKEAQRRPIKPGGMPVVFEAAAGSKHNIGMLALEARSSESKAAFLLRSGADPGPGWYEKVQEDRGVGQ